MSSGGTEHRLADLNPGPEDAVHIPPGGVARAVVTRREQRLEDALVRIRDNARSWHGVPDENDGHVKALRVIATWVDEALDE